MNEHRWRDITGPAIADDPDWRGRSVPSPTFGDGSPASLALGEILPLAPRSSAVRVSYEVYDGQGEGAQPVAPTPETTATLETMTLSKDAAGSEVWTMGSAVFGVFNQRGAIEVEVPAQGLTFIRISSLAGTLPDPGSIRIFADEGVEGS